MGLSFGGELETATEERAISTRSISFENNVRTGQDKRDVPGVRTAVALQSVLADLDGILTVLVCDAARTAHGCWLVWLEFGR